MRQAESADIASNVQLGLLNPRPLLIGVGILGTIISFVNIAFVQTITSTVIVALSFIGLFAIIKLLQKK